MSNIFFLLFLLTFVLLVISLIKPRLLNKIIKREISRKQSGLTLGAIVVVLFILFGVSLPPVEEQKAEVKGESVQNQTSPIAETSSNPTPTSNPTPSLSPKIIEPTPKPSASPVIKSSPSPTPQAYQPPTNSGCDPSYPDVCIPPGAADYDCAGGSGNGPNYISGPLRVLPPDPHDLDRDGDGIGCEN